MTSVGRNLKILREANDFTQEQMANYLGIGRSAYSNYETGEREAPLDVLEKSVALLGCDLALLFEEDEDVVRNEMMVCAFRVNSLSDGDMCVIARFKEAVREYLKMSKMLEE